MKLTMRRIFNFISFHGFIIISMVFHYANAETYNEVKIILNSNDKQTIVHLKESESFLANENLPIWMFRNGKLAKIDYESVMEQLGSFTMYQDRDSSSAAVYFHNRREFDGTIDARYFIEGLSLHDKDDVKNDYNNEINDIKIENHIFERAQWGHADKTGMENMVKVIPSYYAEWTGNELPIEKVLKAASCRYRPQIFYIETLVVINHKMANQIPTKYFNDVSSIVSYVLTVFNTVDMLYSKINTPNIKINIAGIIIENEPGSIPNMAKCYKRIEKFKEQVESLDAFCADEVIRSYLPYQKQIIPIDSYDIVVYLARDPLHEYIYNKETRKQQVGHLAGLTSSPQEGIYEYRRSNGKSKPTVIISEPGYFGSFTTIAHEMVHSFGISNHDKLINMMDEMCCEKLMKPRNGYCQNCLDWSESTRKLLDAVFKSANGCIFKNEPRSLHPPGPRQMLTEDEQCQCYGYESAQNLQKAQKSRKLCWYTIPGRIFGYCNAYLQCVNKAGQIHSAPVPMDGTPCDRDKTSNKVCWNTVCEDIGSMK